MVRDKGVREGAFARAWLDPWSADPDPHPGQASLAKLVCMPAVFICACGVLKPSWLARLRS